MLAGGGLDLFVEIIQQALSRAQARPPQVVVQQGDEGGNVVLDHLDAEVLLAGK
jgi:hypothetical protein